MSNARGGRQFHAIVDAEDAAEIGRDDRHDAFARGRQVRDDRSNSIRPARCRCATRRSPRAASPRRRRKGRRSSRRGRALRRSRRALRRSARRCAPRRHGRCGRRNWAAASARSPASRPAWAFEHARIEAVSTSGMSPLSTSSVPRRVRARRTRLAPRGRCRVAVPEHGLTEACPASRDNSSTCGAISLLVDHDTSRRRIGERPKNVPEHRPPAQMVQHLVCSLFMRVPLPAANTTARRCPLFRALSSRFLFLRGRPAEAFERYA